MKKNSTCHILLLNEINFMELFSRAEAAKVLGVKPRTLWHWEKKKIITPCLYVNTRPRYSLESLQKVATEKQLKSN